MANGSTKYSEETDPRFQNLEVTQSHKGWMTGLYNNKLQVKFTEYMRVAQNYTQHGSKYIQYSFGTKLMSTSIELLDNITECNHTGLYKKTSFKKMLLSLERLRVLWSMYYDLGYLKFKDGHSTNSDVTNDHRKGVIERLLNDIGVMIGAWHRDYKGFLAEHSNKELQRNSEEI